MTALQEHGLATVACLLSSVEVFNENYTESKRLLRLVKGVHGLHVYATEYWSEYVLANAASAHGLPLSTSLLDVSQSFAKKLSCMTEPMEMSINCLDERLELLKPYPNLHFHVAKALQARSQSYLEARIHLSLG